MNKIVLTRKQIGQLSELMDRFEDTEMFVLESESSSGIGPTISVKIDLFENLDTKIDITDVSNW
jgi:hypothetical protein